MFHVIRQQNLPVRMGTVFLSVANVTERLTARIEVTRKDNFVVSLTSVTGIKVPQDFG